MGSTGEADRKRRHVGSISPTGAAAKKHPFMPLSDDKKVNFFNYCIYFIWAFFVQRFLFCRFLE